MVVRYLLTVLYILHGGLNVVAVPTAKSGIDWKFIKRSEWSARPANGSKVTFNGPAPFLIIHHSYDPPAAYTSESCIAAMQYIQDLHMFTNGWNDIGYSFAICGDGNVYVGRGFNMVGAHAPNYNEKSIGLVIIGNYAAQLPTPLMLAVAHDFIDYSVRNGYLREDYIIYGHRQVRSTECPGATFYAEIQTWPHWQDVEPMETTNAVTDSTAKQSIALTIAAIVLSLRYRLFFYCR